VEDVAGVVVRVADGERRQLQRGGEVGGAVGQRLQTLAREGDLLRAHQPLRILDLRFDPDLPRLHPEALLELQQGPVDEGHVAGVADLRHHDAVEVRARVGHHLTQIVEGERARHLVDADDPRLAVPVVAAQRLDNLAPRRGLLQRGARVLQVEEHLVGGALRGLLHHSWVAAGDGEN
jgi:hypothetical protein